VHKNKIKIKQNALSEIDKFKADRAEKASKTRAENEREEEETRKSLQRQFKEGNPWDRVVELIDLKAGKTEGKDVSRMRKILIEMKANQKEKEK